MSVNLPKIVEIVSTHLGVNADQVKPESKIIDDLGADSLDQVELIMAFEEEFSIEITDDEAEAILTINDVIVAIEKKTAVAA